MDLTQHICRACEGGVEPLSGDALTPYIESISPDWTVTNGTRIGRTFHFETFKDTMSFVNKVADLAEKEGHHPDMTINYNKLHIDLTTHAIHGLSENDFILAAKIDIL